MSSREALCTGIRGRLWGTDGEGPGTGVGPQVATVATLALLAVRCFFAAPCFPSWHMRSPGVSCAWVLGSAHPVPKGEPSNRPAPCLPHHVPFLWPRAS